VIVVRAMALGVDLAALFGWLRGRFMRSRGCDGQPPLAAPLTPNDFFARWQTLEGHGDRNYGRQSIPCAG